MIRCARNFSGTSVLGTSVPGTSINHEQVYLQRYYPQSSPQYQKLKRKARAAIRYKRVFYVYGTAEEVVRQGLLDRGWVEKIPRCRMTLHSVINTVFENADEKRKQVERILLSRLVDKVNPNLVWNADTYRYDYSINDTNIIYNRLKTGALWTSKDGLCYCLRNRHWHHIDGVAEINIPRTYTNFDDEETETFIADYRLTACTSLLKWSLMMLNNNRSIAAVKGKIELTVYVFALNRCKEFLNNKQNKDIDTASAPIVNDSQWNLFLQQINLLIDNQALFKSDTEKKLPLYLCYAKLLLIEMVKYRPQLTCDGFKNVWIIKPINFCRGFGIELASDFTKLSDIQNNRCIKKVFQKYIEEPLLIHGTKFDIRQYYLVTSTYPMVIWMYNDCYIKLSTQKYNIKDYHEAIHLTNYAIQSKYAVNKNRSKELPDYNMWSMDTFKNYLLKIGKPDVWSQVIYPGMRKAIVSVMLTCQERIDHGKNRFELYGCDFIFDDTYKPWLIEINCCPDLYPSTEITAKLCPQVVADLLKVVFDHSANPKTSTGKFCCIYRQSSFLPPYVYTKANHFIVRGLALPKEYFYRSTTQIIEKIYTDVEDCNLSSNNETFYTLKTVYKFDSKGGDGKGLTNLIMTDQKIAEMDQEISERVVLTLPESDENLETVAPIITGLLDDIIDRNMPLESGPNADNITILTNTDVSQNTSLLSVLKSDTDLNKEATVITEQLDNLPNHKTPANGSTENNITTAILKLIETTSFMKLKNKKAKSLGSFRSYANLKRTSTEIIHRKENIIEKITSQIKHYNNCVTQSTSATLIGIDRSTSTFKVSLVETGLQMENLIKRMSFGSIFSNENNIIEFMATTRQTHKNISSLESSPVRTLPSTINRIILNTIENLKLVAAQIQDRTERIHTASDEINYFFPTSTTKIPTVQKYSETSPLELIDEINSTAITKKKLKLNENLAQIIDQTNCLLDLFPCEYDKTKDEVINSITTSSLPVHEEKNNVNKFKLNPVTTTITSGIETVVQQTACEDEQKSMNLFECNSEKTTLRNLKSCLIDKLTVKNDLLNNKLPTITTLETPKSTSLGSFSGTLQQTWGSYEDSNTSTSSIKGQEDEGIKQYISKNDLTSIASSNKATGLKFTLNKTNLLQLLRKLLTLEEDFQEAATVLEKQMDNSVVKEESKKDVTLENVPKLLGMTMSQTHKETNASDFTPSESSFLKVTKEILESDGELKEEAIVLANRTDELKNQINCNYDTSQNLNTKLSKSVITTKHEENNHMEIAPLKIYEAEITRRILKSKEKLSAVVTALKSRMSILVAKNSFMNNRSRNMVTKLKRTMSETHKITKYHRHSPQEICPVKLFVEYLKTENVCDNIATEFKESRATKLTGLCNINKNKGTNCLEFTLPEKGQAVIQDFLKISQELDDITTDIVRELYDIMYQVAIRNRSTKNSAKKITEASLLQSSLRQLPIEFTEQSSKSDDLFAPNELLAQLDEFLYHVTSSTPTVCRSDFNYYKKSSFSSFNMHKKTNV